MTARQRSASSLSQHTAASNASSPGGYGQSGGQLPMMGSSRQDTDPLILSAAEIPSFHGDLAPTMYSNEAYPTMTATYIPSGLPLSRPRSNTSSGSTSDGHPALVPGATFPGGLQPRPGPTGRHNAMPMHTGMRHVSTSVLDNSARLGANGGHTNGANGGNFYGGHHANSSSVSIPPPPSNPPPQPSNLPALALSQREYQPHYVRPDYRSHSTSHYPNAAPAYSQHPSNLQVPNIPPPPPPPTQGQTYQPQTYYNSGKSPSEIYRVPAPSSESLPSFSRVDSCESEYGTAGQRGAPIPGVSRGHGTSPLATSNSSALSINPDVAALWTLERVLGYLERHHYATEWQQAFKNLNIHGEAFLELAQNQGLLTYILPEVMRINPNADESSEALTARNIKKMIRELLRVAHSVEENEHPVSRAQRFHNRRSSTMPANYQDKNGPVSEHAFGPSRGNSETSMAPQRPPATRSDASKAVLGSVDNVRHSPSSSETNFRPIQASPQSSPNLNSGGAARHGHTPSTDSITSSTAGHRPGDGKGDKKALIMLGLASRHEKPESPHEKSASRPDFPEHRHGGGKILEKVRKKFWPHREGGEDDDSPTSPGWKSMMPPTLPFASENNGSSSSIDRASTSSMDTSRRARAHSGRLPTSSRPIYALATRDGRIWHTIELTELNTVDAVRKEMCNNVSIREWESASVYLTDLGQSSHNDILSDQQLFQLCERRTDTYGPLMFFIRPASTSVIDNSSRSSLVDPTSPAKRDGHDPRSLFESRPIATGMAASDSQVATLKTATFEQTRKSIESVADTGHTSPNLHEEFDVIRERLAVFSRSQQDDQVQPYSPRPTAQPPSSANPTTASNITSPIDHTPAQSSFTSEASAGWDKNYSDAAPLDEKSDRNGEDFFERKLPPGDRAPTQEMQQQIENKVSPLHQPEPLHEQQPPMLKQPTPPRKRVSRPPDLEGFSHGPMAANRPKRVVDFDNPRPSPFEDRRMEDLIPQRKPPPPPLNRVPSVSYSTVQQAQEQAWPQEQRGHAAFVRRNSIQGNKSMVQIPRGQPKAGGINPSYGIGSGIVSAGQQLSAIARAGGMRRPSEQVPHPSAPQPTPNRAVSASVPIADGPKPPGPRGLKLQIPLTTAKKTTPELSPTDLSAVIKQSSSSLKERQPDVHEGVSEDGGDDDSDGDDGLFAIPIAGRLNASGTAPNTAPNTAGTSAESGLDADAPKRPSVHFKTPPTSSTGSTSALTTDTPPSPEFEAGDDRRGINSPSVHSSSNPASASHAQSPVDYSRLGRRQSFMRDDVWASRPPAESLINNLDDFFPNLDLDQPILDDVQISPPPSPSAASEQRPYSYQLRDPPLPSPVKEDPLESPVMTIPPPMPKDAPVQRQAGDRTSVVARRNVGQSGLSRMKSIREVARGAHESRKRFTQNSTASSSGDSTQQQMMRRKSTKLFGAKLIEVTPMKGRRGMMRQREPIPQVPPQHQQQGQGGVKRQATFKWFKGELIGKGTYGRVYLGMNATTGEFLAVKQVEVSRVSGDSERQKEMIAALNQEIETMQHLDHENIVQYLGCERKEYSMSIFLEYISGGSIGSCLRKHGRFPEDLVSNLTRQILEGLMYLHSEGILHRDLKADNILLDVDGTCKISDFGISKKTDNIYGDDPGNSMQGSVFWMAPEVIRPEGQGYSAKIDIWSLGCVVLEMLAGRRPWSKEEAIGAIYKLGSERQAPPIPEDVSSVVSPWAIGFLADCHTIDPSERPTAKTLLGHVFCRPNPDFNFLETELYQKISGIL